MSRDVQLSAEPLEHIDQLVEYFASGEKSADRLGFGTEHEKFVFRRSDGQMLSHEEEGGFGDLLEALAERFGWERSFDESGSLIALVKDGGAITLEPGGQLELSGAVTKTVFETRDEFDAHMAELREIAGDRLLFATLGMNPFFGPEQVPWMPKTRYGIMRRYLPTRGDLAHWMMKATCTVQGNYDYTSEADAVEILRTGLRVSPLVSALFAASPLKQGAPSGFQTYRCHIWTRTDPDRTGFPDFMLGTDWGYEDYANYVLDVPMFFIRRDDRYVDLAGLPFRAFMEQGHHGHHATIGDFELHLSTVFPEVRMKKYIEVRGADAGRREVMLALPALFKGLFYWHPARKAAADLIPDHVTPDQLREGALQIHREGIHAKTTFGDVAELSRALVQIARDGLDALAERDGHPTEAGFLDPLTTILDTNTSQSDALLADFQAADGDWLRLMERWQL